MVAIEGWAKTSEFTAIKTIIYTDISRDGMLAGPNLKAMEEMVKAEKRGRFRRYCREGIVYRGFGFERSHRSGEIRGELNGHKKNNSLPGRSQRQGGKGSQFCEYIRLRLRPIMTKPALTNLLFLT